METAVPTDPNLPANLPTIPPPAAAAVANGKTEREAQLERELETAETARKKAETDAAYAQDEARSLKEAQAAAPKPSKAFTFRTLFHETED